jgi:O-antigen/teichoic acid export membrane protein
MSNSKRLAKNAMMMYLRMIVLMGISLYTSRVILKQLGVEDFGIYNLVGSIVMMFNSLRCLFASSTQRFLNYEMGAGNQERLKLVFNMSVRINLLISIIFVVLAEIVGLWFFEYNINIPADRYVAAMWVFQFSLLSAILSIMTTPYDAVIIAHEKMDFYAYMSIFEGVMRLLLVFMLSIVPYDKLIVYGFLQLILAFIVMYINAKYCNKYYQESQLMKCWDKELFVKMTKFAGWNFLGNTSFALSQNGLNMILNTFGGAIVNAARGLSYQVKSCVSQITNNLIFVFKPYYIKLYAEGEIDASYKVMYLSEKIYYTIQLCATIFVTFLTHEILQLWLGQVPEYSVIFIKLVFVDALIRTLHNSLDMLFSAVGDMKYYQICEGIVLAMPLPISYIMLSCDFDYSIVFVLIIVFDIINHIAITCIAKKICRLRVREYLKNSLFPCAMITIIAICAYFVNSRLVLMSHHICLAFLTSLIVCLVMYKFGLKHNERAQLLQIIRK